MDILSTALGKPDYRGRVVGEPGRVTVNKYFGKKVRSRKETPDEVESRVLATVKGEMAMFAERIAMLEEQLQSRTAKLGDTSPSPQQRV